MVNPARIPEPRSGDPLDPALDNRIDPVTGEPRAAANTEYPRTVNRVENRTGGSGLIIAAVVLVLAVIAYFVFVPASNNVADVTVETPAAVTTEPAAPAPDATAPEAAPEPDATAPEAPADPAAPAPDATAPDATAPDATAPATEPAPAQ